MASFRGVPFICTGVETKSGRRVATLEFPQRDEPETKDLGRAARSWSVSGSIVRDKPAELAYERRRLILACDAAGPATLVLPDDGALVVQCTTVSVSDSTNSNAVDFVAEFVEAGTVFDELPKPRGTGFSLAGLIRAALRVYMVARLQVMATARRVKAALTGSVEERMRAILGLIGQATGVDTAALDEAIAAVADQVVETESDVEELFDLLGAVVDEFESSDDAAVLATYAAETFADTWPAAPADTADGEIINENNAVLSAVLYGLALARQGDALTTAEFVTYDDATTALETYAARSYSVQEALEDSDTCAALADMLAAVAEAVRIEAASLPRLITYTIQAQATTALELAQRLYGDPERADEIVQRNNLREPFRVTGALRVLST